MNSTHLRKIFFGGLFLLFFVGRGFSDGFGIIIPPPPPPPPPPKPPAITVAWPANGGVVTNSSIFVVGTVSNGDAPGAISLSGWVENASGYTEAEGIPNTNSWSFPADLIPGWNTVKVYASDSQYRSAQAAIRVYYQQFLPLQLVINGQGTVTPNETNLEVTQGYQMTAKPAPGYAFAGWTGDVVESNSVTVSFTMRSNMVLVANFVPTPFLARNYHGLLVPFNSSARKISGSLDLALTPEGDFTGKVRLGKNEISFSGTFLTNGSFITQIYTVHKETGGALGLELHLDSEKQTLAGNLASWFGIWQVVATTSLYDGKTNPAPQAGRYTLLIPGEEGSSAQPGGDGYASVLVETSGRVSVSGRLSDGTPFAEKTIVSVDGEWPVYVSLYSGNGSISGWLTFTNTAGSDIVGTLDWIKPSSIKKGLYPSGFEIHSEVVGSSYDSRNLNFTSSFLMLTNGGLSEPITIVGNPTIIPQGKSNKQKGTGASLKFAPATGTFSGTVSGIPVNGVILPKQGFGGGFFLGTEEAGRVYLGP